MNSIIKTKFKDLYNSMNNQIKSDYVKELTKDRFYLNISLDTINKLRFSQNLRPIDKNGELI